MAMLKIPRWVITPVKDVCLSASELNTSMIGQLVYVLIVDNGCTMDVISCPCPHLKDIAFYANYFDVFKDNLLVAKKVLLIRAEVMDPVDLPFKEDTGTCVYTIYDDWCLSEHESIEDSTSDIEGLLNYYKADITDFTILIGREMSLGVKEKLIKLIEIYSDKSMWECGEYDNWPAVSKNSQTGGETKNG